MLEQTNDCSAVFVSEDVGLIDGFAVPAPEAMVVQQFVDGKKAELGFPVSVVITRDGVAVSRWIPRRDRSGAVARRSRGLMGFGPAAKVKPGPKLEKMFSGERSSRLAEQVRDAVK